MRILSVMTIIVAALVVSACVTIPRTTPLHEGDRCALFGDRTAEIGDTFEIKARWHPMPNDERITYDLIHRKPSGVVIFHGVAYAHRGAGDPPWGTPGTEFLSWKLERCTLFQTADRGVVPIWDQVMVFIVGN